MKSVVQNRVCINYCNQASIFVLDCRNKTVDIGFILDNSRSINFYAEDNAWQRHVLGFVTALVRRFGVSETNARFGVVDFSSDAELRISIDQYTDIGALLPAIRALPFVGGRTNIAAGLRTARTDLFNYTSRPDSQKIAILFTDGAATDEVASTLAEAANLKQAGVEIFTVGVGRADQEELAKIASLPGKTHNFYVNETEIRYIYARLDQVVEPLSSAICDLGIDLTTLTTTPVATLITTSPGTPVSSVTTSTGTSRTPASPVSSTSQFTLPPPGE